MAKNREVPSISREAKVDLIMELLAFSVTNARILDFTKSKAGITDIIVGIFKDQQASSFNDYIPIQQLKKAPELLERLKSYLNI